MTAVLWYVHDHGHGHLQRARAVLRHVKAPVTVAAGPGLGPAVRLLDRDVVTLPTDTVDGRACPRGPWHHAPDAPAQRARMTALSSLVERRRCSVAVVDVSAEVTTMMTLLGLRTIALRQSGRRDDPAHRIAYGGADTVWVPQHESLEPINGPIDARWHFTGAFSRYDDHARPDRRRRVGQRRALIVVGRGGTAFDERRWQAAAPPTGWRVAIAGTTERWRHGDVVALGRVDPIEPWLRAADVVITSAGWSSVADAVALRRRLVIVPESRPFDEQLTRAEALAAAGLVRSLPAWPDPHRLAAVLADAVDLDPSAWDPYHDGLGAQRAAALVDEAAA